VKPNKFVVVVAVGRLQVMERLHNVQPANIFFYVKNVFARDLNTHTSVLESTKIVPVQLVDMQKLPVQGGKLLPRQVTAGVAVKK
jgi:hypothetical protein